MNILTDILSLFKRKKVTSVVNPNDVVIVGKNEQPDMEGISSPVPYKKVELVRVRDLIQSQDLTFENVPDQDPVINAGCFRDKTTDPVTGEGIINFRRFKALSLNLSITENGDFIDFDCTAEANTASNVGSGARVFKQKVGEDLEFRSITSSDDSLIIVENADEIDIRTDIATDGTTITGSGTVSNPLTVLSSASGGNQLISGGASYSGTGLVFDVSALEYLIAGVQYTAAPTQVTLNAGDPTNPRFDAIVADDLQVVSVVQGTPAATPITPAIGDDQILVQYILVGAAATTPSITTEYVYREGSTPDWTGGTSAASNSPVADFASPTPPPFQGVECTSVDYSLYSTGRWLRWTTGSPINRADYAVVSMRIYLEDDLTSLDGGVGRRMFCRLYGAGIFCGTVYLQNWGLNNAAPGSWQLVSIPMAAFLNNPQQTTIDEIRIQMVEYIGNVPVPAATTVGVDDVKFQSGFGPQVNTATIDILDDGAPIASTARLNFEDTSGIIHEVVDDPSTNTVTVKSKINESIVTLTDPGSGPIPVDFLNGNILQITLSASAAYNFPLPLNMNVGATYMIIVIQEGTTGGATATFGSDYMWSGGTQPTLTATPGAVDILSFVCITDPSTGLPALAGVPTLNLQ